MYRIFRKQERIVRLAKKLYVPIRSHYTSEPEEGDRFHKSESPGKVCGYLKWTDQGAAMFGVFGKGSMSGADVRQK